VIIYNEVFLLATNQAGYRRYILSVNTPTSSLLSPAALRNCFLAKFTAMASNYYAVNFDIKTPKIHCYKAFY